MTVRSLQGARPSQRGVAILAITIILLLVATIATLMVGRVGLYEQKLVGTDVRAKEVNSAAVGGLEYAVRWFEENYVDLPWSDADGNGIPCAGDTATPDALANTALSADTYAHQITYTLRNCLDQSPIVATATSRATAVADSHVAKTVEVDVMVGVITNSPFGGTVQGEDPSVFQGPPVMVESCMSGITGTPDIYPNADLGIAIGTTQGTVGCLDHGHFDLHGGSKLALTPAMSLAQAVFGVEITTFTDADDKYAKEEAAIKEKLLALETENPDRVFVVDSTYPHFPAVQPSYNNNWHNNLGSADAPVILYFDQTVDCPKINGGTTIYGLVYYAKRVCSTNGWGGGTVHGTVAKRGDMTKFTANAAIHGESLDYGDTGGDGEGGDSTTIGEPGGIFSENRFAEIPGSWRDF